MNINVGVGLVDELLKAHLDPITGEELIAYNTLNTDDETDELVSKQCLYVLKAQGINSDIIANFIALVDGGKLRLLDKVDQNSVDLAQNNFMEDILLSSVQTDFLVEEISNLRLIFNKNGSMSVEQNTKKYDKDRYSALVYLLYYIMYFENKQEKKKEIDVRKTFKMSKPRLRK